MRPSRTIVLAGVASLSALFSVPRASAQPSEGTFLELSAGLGLSTPYDDTDVGAMGALVKVEYALVPLSWLGIRPYAAGLFTWPTGEDGRCVEHRRDCELATRVAMVGGKARVALPLPLFSPFLELGFGGSLGLLRTQTLAHAIEQEDPTYHLPIGIGAAMGPNHELELGFAYYFHPAAQQFSNGLTVGFSIQLTGKRRGYMPY